MRQLLVNNLERMYPSEIARWQAFCEFTAFSASEMESGALDTWLTDEEGDPPPPPPKIGDGSYKIDVDSLGFRDRRAWLASLLMPKPVVLVGTKSKSGVENIAPMSSISIVEITHHFSPSHYRQIERGGLEIHW